MTHSLAFFETYFVSLTVVQTEVGVGHILIPQKERILTAGKRIWIIKEL